MKCYIHEDREASKILNIPCSPTPIAICAECDNEVGMVKAFEKYKASHSKRIKLFKGVRGNPGN